MGFGSLLPRLLTTVKVGGVHERDPAAFPGNAAAKLFAGHQNKDGTPRKPQPLKAADGTAFLSFALDEIDQRNGSVEAYLDSEVGVKPADIAKLRATYLE
jgi:protein-tyrosine phosphatase